MTREGITTCPACGTTWTGYRPAHCVQCHEMFTSHAAFDRHLDVNYNRDPAVKCRDPQEAGLQINHRGFWTTPMPPEALAAITKETS